VEEVVAAVVEVAVEVVVAAAATREDTRWQIGPFHCCRHIARHLNLH